MQRYRETGIPIWIIRQKESSMSFPSRVAGAFRILYASVRKKMIPTVRLIGIAGCFTTLSSLTSHSETKRHTQNSLCGVSFCSGGWVFCAYPCQPYGLSCKDIAAGLVIVIEYPDLLELDDIRFL